MPETADSYSKIIHYPANAGSSASPARLAIRHIPFPRASENNSARSRRLSAGSADRPALRRQHLNLPQFRDDLLRTQTFPRHCISASPSSGSLKSPGSEKPGQVIPLAPDIAIRITPDPSSVREQDLSFARMRFRTMRPKLAKIQELNKLIVQSAEELVFFRDDLYWIPDFVARNRDFRVEPITNTIPADTGYYVVATQRIRRRSEAL
jgi:hypothetical protein